MPKPRPQQAKAPEPQRPERETRASTKGASAPFVVPGGENTMKQAPNAPASGTKPSAPVPQADKAPESGPAMIVFGHTEHRIPQAAWFPASEAELATRAARLMGLRVLRIEDDAHRQLAARLRQGQVYAADRTFAPAVQRELFDQLSALAGPVAAPSPVEITASKSNAASRPASWQAIAVGDLVIAHESSEDGWWEAIVVALEGEKLVLRWRDYARMPCVRRGRLEVALLPPVAA